MSGSESTTFKAVLFTIKEGDKVLKNVVESKDSGDLGGNIGRSLCTAALDVANSGLLGPEVKGIAELFESIFGTAKKEGEDITKDLDKLKQMLQDIIHLNKDIEQQLSAIDSKIDQLANLLQWTYALGNTHPYAVFLDEVIQRWKNAAKYDLADGTLDPRQLDLATQFTAVDAGALENQLELFYKGVIGDDITGVDQDLGLLSQFIKQSWNKLAANDLKTWYLNTTLFVSKVKSLLLNGIHVMIWAIQATSPDDLDEYQQKYGSWLQTVDDQLKKLLPTIMHQLFVNDTAYDFRIQPFYDDHVDPGFTATDSFEKDGYTLQRLIFPSGDIQPDDSIKAIWQAPPELDVIKGLVGTLRNVSQRSQFKVSWDIDQLTIKIIKADAGKLNPNEPMMCIGSMQTTYYMKDAIDGDYSFTQDDAVLTTDTGFILDLIAQPDWNNRNVWRLMNTGNQYYMATGIQHPTTDFMLRDPSEHLLRFFNAIDDASFSTRWVFETI